MTSFFTNKVTGRSNNASGSGFSRYAGLTDCGRIRKKNEDNLGLFPEQSLFFVADGVGGMPAGEVASMLVVEVLPSLLKQRLKQGHKQNSKIKFSVEQDKSEISLRLKQAIIDLSNRISSQSQNQPEYAGMASTLVLALITQENLYIAHLGDSRAYLLKNGILQQMTNDHTLIRHLLMTKAITQEEAAHHPGKNQLVQYIGMTMSPKPDVICIPRIAGEKILLCSDGLSDMLSKQVIGQILEKNMSPEMTCKMLVEEANHSGGKDNITVVIVE